MVIDPGMFTEVSALDGATAVLVTHEHPDHWDADVLAATDAPIWTHQAVADAIAKGAPGLRERVTVIAPGDSFDVGLPVRAVNDWHAVIHPDYPRVHNTGYLVSVGDRTVYHPGDALELPGTEVDVLCAPSSAPWLKISEAIDFVRAVGAPVNVAVHDRIYTEAAHGMLATHMGNLLPEGQQWVRLADGEHQ